jgi:hypothetical protein
VGTVGWTGTGVGEAGAGKANPQARIERVRARKSAMKYLRDIVSSPNYLIVSVEKTL